MKVLDKIIITCISLSVILLSGCADDFHFGEAGVVSGEPAVVSADLLVSDMPKVTRADALTEENAYKLNSVWIGFFDAGTKELKYQFTRSIQYSIKEDATVRLTPLEITSGEYIIGAIGNPDANYGVLYKLYGGANNIKTRTELTYLLQHNVQTYDDFCAIALRRGSDDTYGVIDSPLGNLPMQGIFVPDGQRHPTTSDEAYTMANAAVRIDPNKAQGAFDAVRLKGTIHFRRLISQNSFNIKFNSDKIESYELLSATVYNVPAASWLAERPDAAPGNNNFVNAGDHPDLLGIEDASVQRENPVADAQRNYMRSTTIFPSQITSDNDGLHFDWWQLENRRSSSTAKIYEDREEENRYESSNGKNSGIYTALSGSSLTQVPANNCASYVRFTVRMTLKDDYFSNYDDANGIIIDNATMTTAEVTYTVHLGYCEGNDIAARSKDFNCRRNTKYDYTVTINGVDKVILEAQKAAGQYEHGAEGTVTFITDNVYEGDAHYLAYNIQLSDAQRATGDWQMRIYLSQDNYEDITLHVQDGDQSTLTTGKDTWKFDWVEMAPAPGQNELAEYLPVGAQGSQTIKMTDFNDLTKCRLNSWSPGNANSDVQRWYTIFINEYVYDKSESGTGSTQNWKDFVNLPARSFWIKIQEYRSVDHESIVINSKYAFRQKAIQTYFSTSDASVTKAIGMEQYDELKYTPLTYFGVEDKRGLDRIDLSNIADARNANWQYLTQYDSKINYSSDKYWYNFINPTIPLPADGNIANKYDGQQQIGVCAPFDAGEFNSYGYTVVARLACLNRNRDLNGNGIIDPNELRWILPNVKQYIGFIMGSQGLNTPIFNYLNPIAGRQDIQPGSVLYTQTDYTHKRELHMASIDNSQLWTEEGVSAGWLAGCPDPQQVRCIRYLGADVSASATTMPTGTVSGLSDPYEILAGHPDVIQFNITPENRRGEKAVTDALPWHRTNSILNRPYRYMQFIIHTDGNKSDKIVNGRSDAWFTELEKGNPCGGLNEGSQKGWRVPNQVELEALRACNPDGFAQNTDSLYTSCTREYYSPNRRMGAQYTYSLAIDDGAQANVAVNHIRCVRDVDLTDLSTSPAYRRRR